MASRKGRKGMQRGGQERRHAEAAGSSCVSSPSSCMSDFQIESGPCRTPLEGECPAGPLPPKDVKNTARREARPTDPARAT